MIDPLTTISLTPYIYEILKYWIPLGSIIIGGYKVIQWVKSKLVNINNNVNIVNQNIDGLREDVKEQTKSIVAALSKQRADFRTFYAPVLLHNQLQMQTMAAAPARAKRTLPPRKLKNGKK